MGQVFNTVYPIKTRARATMPLELLTRLTSGASGIPSSHDLDRLNPIQ